MLNEYRDEFVPQNPGYRRAIVLGGGIAGLLACRVLAGHFDQVTLLERDDYPAGPIPRAGVPQAKHVHLLLVRGRRILEDLFSGLHKELVQNGAVVVKMGDELAALTYHGWRVKHSGGLTLLTFTQPLLEWCIRRRLRAYANIRIIEKCRVTGLIAGEGKISIQGVQCQFPEDGDRMHRLDSDLVVDASGRSSRAPEWLETIGIPRPEETIVDSFLGYSSRLYEVGDKPVAPHAFRDKWKALLLLGKPPEQTRGGVLLPVEGNRWHVTLVGIGKDYPPNSENGFLEFARTLRSSVLYEAIRKARPLSPVSGYRATKNRRRHYEKLLQWPEGLVVLGDALCAFNPVYAQGMSVAAMEVVLLDQVLREASGPREKYPSTAPKFQKSVAKILDMPWLMATTDDLRWPATEGGRADLPTRLMHCYLDSVLSLATQYPEIDHRFAEVAHLIQSPYMLFHPRIAAPAFARLFHSSLLSSGKPDRL